MNEPSDNQNYHNDTHYIGRSGLHEFSKLPWHYWNRYLNPDRTPFKPSDAMVLGSLVHCEILEPKDFQNQFAIMPAGLSNKKEHKQQKDLFRTANNQKEIVTLDQVRQARWLKERILSHPTARQLLEGEGVNEKSHFYNHPLTGSPAKIKPDRDIVETHGLLIDLKKVADASEFSFAKSCINFWYHVQVAWYMDGYAEATGVMPKGFVFILVEEATGLVAVRYAPNEMIQLGRRIYQKHLEYYEECRQKNEWPGYPKTVEPVSLPAWAYNNY